MRKTSYYVLVALAALCIIVVAFFLAETVSTNGAAREIVEDFGIAGVIVVAIIAGLNVVIPIHVATFTPVFIEAGFKLTTIIFAFSFGTIIADLIGYTLGTWGKHAASIKHPKFHQKLLAFNERHQRFMLPGIFLFAAFVPLPNEVFLIPLGLVGFRLVALLPPLILGTLLNHTLYSLGFVNVFELFFG